MKRTGFSRKPAASRQPRERVPMVLVPRPAGAPRAVMARASAEPTNPAPPRAYVASKFGETVDLPDG